jgi:hypothetical protein
MVRMMRHVQMWAATILLASAGLTAAAETIGKGVTMDKATAIADLYAHPEKFLGKTIRVDGVGTAVCEEMGCWITIAAADKPAETVRFKIEHEGTMAFPATAKGKQISAEGVFTRIAASDNDANEAARESGAKPSDFGATYQVMLSGAVIK